MLADLSTLTFRGLGSSPAGVKYARNSRVHCTNGYIVALCTAPIVCLVIEFFLALIAGPIETKIAERLEHALQSRIMRAELSSRTQLDGIIVLGGWPTRVAAALVLAERFPNAPIVLSGPEPSEVALAKAHLGQSDRLVIDRRPKNTYENAVFSRDLVEPRRLGKCWIVVTSALHMPRAFGAFQAIDFPVLPWPVHDRQKGGSSDPVWHEVLGLAWYWALGRIRHVYPRVEGAKKHRSETTESCL